MRVLRGVGQALVLVALGLTGGCARVVTPGGTPHGNVTAALVQGQTEADRARQRRRPVALLVERNGLRAVRPATGQTVWRHGLHVTGHIAAGQDTIAVPIRGHRVVALDRASGEIRWQAELSGEALTGLAVSDPWIVATTVGGQGKGRSRLTVLSAEDGNPRWARRSPGLFGVPAAIGKVAFVTLDREVLALRLPTGREIVRVKLPEHQETLERVELHGSTAVAGGGMSWVDLGAGARTAQALETSYAEAFRKRAGVDPGYDDRERLAWWVRASESGDVPRDAMLIGRRAVLAVRVGSDGRPKHAHWLHTSKVRLEIVGVHVTPRRVLVVREDGSMLHLSAEDGRELLRTEPVAPIFGATVLDYGQRHTRNYRPHRLPQETVRPALAALLEDLDVRVLPAQELAVDLLWRDEDPLVRETVLALGAGDLRPDASRAADALRGHALDLIEQPWGSSDAESRRRLLVALRERPSYMNDVDPDGLSRLARRAVLSADPEVVTHLVDHLLHPATRPADLSEVARALRKIGREEAIEGIRTFVLRYHADSEVVYESRALHQAVGYLVDRAADRAAAASGRARETLAFLLADPFTDPQIRELIRRSLPADVELDDSVYDVLDEDIIELTDDDGDDDQAVSDSGM